MSVGNRTHQLIELWGSLQKESANLSTALVEEDFLQTMKNPELLPQLKDLLAQLQTVNQLIMVSKETKEQEVEQFLVQRQQQQERQERQDRERQHAFIPRQRIQAQSARQVQESSAFNKERRLFPTVRKISSLTREEKQKQYFLAGLF
jgi:hypothetical protein